MPARITVAVDANGADLGPREVAAGAALAAEHGVRVRLYGPAAEIGDVPEGVELIDAPVSIAKDPDPARAARREDRASIVLAARDVAAGDADALVSGGATGAMLAAGLLHLGRAEGVARPALALSLPLPGRGEVLLLDVGANAEVRAEHLVQFAYMGAAFAEAVLGLARPRVALLSNGEEASRGTEAVLAAHTRLAQDGAAGRIAFVGNVEGTGVTEAVADVIVTDGFTGNVVLKLVEGVAAMMLGAVRDVASASARGRLGGVLLRPGLRRFREEIDPEGPGGAYLLGLRRVGVVCHGRFGRRGFANAIAVAERGVRERVVERTHEALLAGGALRHTPSAAASGEAASVPSP